MRARMAIAVSGQKVRLREVVLRDKPTEMLEASPKGTVPVLQLPNGSVLDESIDVMGWALSINDPDNWLEPQKGALADIQQLIANCDGSFKHHLDRFKYSARYEDVDPTQHRDAAAVFLEELDGRLSCSRFLFGDAPGLADIAIFPFIRQFAGASGDWFRDGRFSHLVPWLDGLVSAPLFTNIMRKYPQWHTGGTEAVFPDF